MFKKLKLKNRIYTGFIVVGLISLGMAVISVVAFYYANNNFGYLVQFSNKSHLAVAILRDVSEIQRQALIYTHEGHQSAANRVHEIHQRISAQIKQESQQDSKYFQDIVKHLDTYVKTFKQVQQQRTRQAVLVHSEIRTLASEAENHFLKHIVQASSTADIETQLNNQRILNSLLQIEKYAMRYFDTLDSKDVIFAKNALSQVQKSLQTIQKQDAAKPVSEHILQTIQFINNYEQVFLEAVQRTRGYLFLINVVMSAEAYEIIYRSQRMDRQLEQEMNKIQQRTLSLMQQVIIVIISSSIIFLILITVFSILISRSITIPIEKLTATFIALAKGSRLAKIPDYKIQDEIGALTEAAVVFKGKNKQTEELLAQSTQLTNDLERSNDELEQFVYTVSHDLKSPLVTSMGFIGIIQKLAAAGKMQDAIDKLDRVVSSNRRMGQLINDLLELSRVGRIETDKTTIDLNKLLESFYQNHLNQLTHTGFTLSFDSTLPTLYVNESRILQIFENLLVNALKYAINPNGSVINIGASETEEHQLIYFKDNGPGIAKEYHKKIFGLFYRLNNDKEGTGIGLAVAAKVMKFHNGSIWVESEPNNGATFWLKFPKINKETD